MIVVHGRAVAVDSALCMKLLDVMQRMELHYPPLVPTASEIIQQRAVAWANELQINGVTANEVDELYSRARAYKRGEHNLGGYDDPDKGLSDRAAFPPTVDHLLLAWVMVQEERFDKAKREHEMELQRQRLKGIEQRQKPTVKPGGVLERECLRIAQKDPKMAAAVAEARAEGRMQ